MDENARLRVENERLLAQNGDVRSKYAQLQQVAQQMQHILRTASIEKDSFLHQIASLKQQLELREKECADCRGKLQAYPDAKALEAQLKEENDIKMRLHKELQENGNFREKYNELRREYCMLKNDYEQKLQAQEKLLATKSIDAESKIVNLTAIVADLEARAEDRASTNLMKTLQREKSELEERVKVLTSELLDSRDGLGHQVTQAMESSRLLTCRFGDLTQQLKLQSADLLRQKEMNKALLEEQQRLRLEVDQLHSDKLKLESEAAYLKAEVDSSEHKIRVASSNAREVLKERAAEWQRERCALETRVAELQKRASDLEVEKHELVRQREETDRHIKAKVAEMKDEDSDRLKSLERELTRVTLERQDEERAQAYVLSSLREQVAALKKENSQLAAQRQDEHGSHAASVAKQALLQRRVAGLEKEKEELQLVLQAEREAAERLKSEIEHLLDIKSENGRLKLEVDYVKRDYAQLELERDQLLIKLDKHRNSKNQLLLEQQDALQAVEVYRTALSEVKQKNAQKASSYERRLSKLGSDVSEKDVVIQELKQQVRLLSAAAAGRTTADEGENRVPCWTLSDLDRILASTAATVTTTTTSPTW